MGSAHEIEPALELASSRLKGRKALAARRRLE
jgi:hypothetical protein